MSRLLAACLLAIAVGSLSEAALAQTPPLAPLQLEAKIPLGNVSGRIDHLAVDLNHQRLFVAELGNSTVGVLDLNERKVRHLITGLKEPQGVGYVLASDTLFVANAGDGSVLLFRGDSYISAGRIDLRDDADNVRVDAAANRLFVGYGDGGLAVIDTTTNAKIGDIKLPAHPESFQLARADSRIFVNLPGAHAIGVVDRAAGKQIATWKLDSGSHFPMAIDEEAGRVLVASRSPARMIALSMRDGSVGATTDICGDSDDLFLDARRHRIYASCGDGFVDVLEPDGNSYRRLARVPTIVGARTALFVPESDRLFVAARANGAEPAAIWVLRPTP